MYRYILTKQLPKLKSRLKEMIDTPNTQCCQTTTFGFTKLKDAGKIKKAACCVETYFLHSNLLFIDVMVIAILGFEP